MQLLIHLLGRLHLLRSWLWIRWEGRDVAKVWMVHLLRTRLILIVRIEVELRGHLARWLLLLLRVWVREIGTITESWRLQRRWIVSLRWVSLSWIRFLIKTDEVIAPWLRWITKGEEVEVVRHLVHLSLRILLLSIPAGSSVLVLSL